VKLKWDQSFPPNKREGKKENFADKNPMFWGKTKIFKGNTRATVSNGVIFFRRGKQIRDP
jgi:hypothetical protein